MKKLVALFLAAAQVSGFASAESGVEPPRSELGPAALSATLAGPIAPAEPEPPEEPVTQQVFGDELVIDATGEETEAAVVETSRRYRRCGVLQSAACLIAGVTIGLMVSDKLGPRRAGTIAGGFLIGGAAGIVADVLVCSWRRKHGA